MIVAVVVIGIFWIVTWLLAPYSRLAFESRQPRPEHFERQRSRAERIGKLPVIGPIFRFGDRVSGGAGGKMASEYQKWVQDHSVENPHRPKD
jgi:hypothetical protein